MAIGNAAAAMWTAYVDAIAWRRNIEARVKAIDARLAGRQA